MPAPHERHCALSNQKARDARLSRAQARAVPGWRLGVRVDTELPFMWPKKSSVSGLPRQPTEINAGPPQRGGKKIGCAHPPLGQA